MSLVTPTLDIAEISSIGSQVTPQAESIEMVQYSSFLVSLATLTPRVVNSKVFLDADAVQPRTPRLFQCELEDTAYLEGFSEY